MQKVEDNASMMMTTSHMLLQNQDTRVSAVTKYVIIRWFMHFTECMSCMLLILKVVLKG